MLVAEPIGTRMGSRGELWQLAHTLYRGLMPLRVDVGSVLDGPVLKKLYCQRFST